MNNRPAFQLKTLIIAYNCVQVVTSAWIVYKVYFQHLIQLNISACIFSISNLMQLLLHGWLFKYSYSCQPMDYSDDADEVAIAHVCWWYYFSKFIEFLDTIFFLLRKKDNQITNLHVIHHSVMPVHGWLGAKFAPGGHLTFLVLVNSLVHVVMYTYYLLAAMGPEYQKYLWWKKHLTTFQLVQFAFVLHHNAQALYNGCNFPKFFLYLYCFQSIKFICLFANFFIKVKENGIKTGNNRIITASRLPFLKAYYTKRHLAEKRK